MIDFNKSSNEERFDFHAEGVFRKPFKTEKPLLAVILVCALGVQAFIVCYAINFIKEFTATSSMFSFLVLILFSIICWFVAAFLATIATSGVKCRYSADDKSITFTDGEKKKEYFYADVVKVTYKETKKSFFHKRLRVTVETKYKKEKLEYIYPRSMPDKSVINTPFHILEERAGLTTEEQTENEA